VSLKSRTQQDFCYRCGTPWSKDDVLCRACGSRDRGRGVARPTIATTDDAIHFPWPWQHLPWPKQGSAVVSGGPGSGKSSLLTLLKPKAWLSREMEPKLIRTIFDRVSPDCVPTVYMVHNSQTVGDALAQINEGPVALDSLTALDTPADALLAAHLLVDWAKDHDDRSVAICQINKQGQAAGFQEIIHLFDVHVELEAEGSGMRTFSLPKSRWSPLFSTYWNFNEHGQIAVPVFDDAAYSVEGSPGGYYLHPFPLKGASWAGLLQLLDDIEELKPGCASSAHPARYTDSGFLQPRDWIERKQFAENHGLTWLDPDDIGPATIKANEQKLIGSATIKASEQKLIGSATIKASEQLIGPATIKTSEKLKKDREK